MFPLLFAAKALGKMSPFGKSLDGKSVKNTTTEASAEKDAETAASAKTNAVMQNVSNTTDTDKPEKEKEMFGGMDLGKIKSALDEDSPIGMPSEVKGGVYKQIFEVNKMMLGSLQRIESTMKLLLGLEYERAAGFQQQERDENLTEGDTDDKGGEKGPGRFKRGLSAAGDMLGGAYGGLKKFGSGSIAKLLGLGVLIFAFNKYREEIITAMAGILEYFSDVYDVFKSEGLSAAFNKVVDDFKTIFFPKIKEVSLGILDFLWGAIKGVATEWLFGTQGDLRIKQEAESLKTNKSGLQEMAKGLTDTELDAAAKDFRKDSVSNSPLSLEERSQLRKDKLAVIFAMQEISDQSKGRIQWSGFPFDMTRGVVNLKTIAEAPVSTILNSLPIIDGEKQTSWDVLDNINLGEMGGITKGMTEDRVEEIETNLKKRSMLANSIAAREGDPEFATSFSSFINNRALKRLEEDKLELETLKTTNIGQIFAPSGPKSSLTTKADFSSTGDTSGKKLSREEEVKKRMDELSANRKYPTNVTSAFDQKRINNVNASTTNNLGLSANPTSDVVRAFRIRALTEST